MEVVVVSLIFILLSQWMWGSPSKQAQSSEPTPLITAPEPQPNGEKVRLLLDEQPESLPADPVAVEPIAIEADQSVDLAASLDGSSMVEEQEAIAPIPPLESPVTLEAEAVLAVGSLTNNVVAMAAMNPDEAVDPIPSSGFIAELTEFAQPAAIPQNTSRPASRRDEVWALLDQATTEGVEGYAALLSYVKENSGKGTSRSTIQAWKQARTEAVICG